MDFVADLRGPNRAMPPRCAMRFESHQRLTFASVGGWMCKMGAPSVAPTPKLSEDACFKGVWGNLGQNWDTLDLQIYPPTKPITQILPSDRACDAKSRHVFQYREMQNACASDSRCIFLPCDASAPGAKSLVMWVERCEPLRCRRP